ncbi:MAG: hypothetical protein ACLS5O_11200 [[Clostridium] leptum]
MRGLSAAVSRWDALKKRYPLKTRAQKPKIEKPAVRELLTAGVGGSDEIVVRWSNAVWKEFINPKSKGTLSKKRITGSEEIHLIVFTTRFSAFCFLMSHFYKKR